MESLRQRSIEIILNNQVHTGAYYACPTFPMYQYAWFRDGSFCAYAMDLYAHYESAHNFYKWSIATIDRYRNKLRTCVEKAASGLPPTPGVTLHARFTIDGEEIPGRWGNHQLDGLGTWLWAICDHICRSPDPKLRSDWLAPLFAVRDYLMALWRYPCSDCWEENEHQVHTYTLGAIYAGLQALGEIYSDEIACQAASKVREFIQQNAVRDGHLVKSLSDFEVDGSLVALAIPYRVYDPENPVIAKTIDSILEQLATPGGGIRRYLKDTYYGGGEWVILTAWMGWWMAQTAHIEQAVTIHKWIEQQASPAGDLPEQLPRHLMAPDFYGPWVKRWGPIASPLLWSHAMYLILNHALEEPGSFSRESK